MPIALSTAWYVHDDPRLVTTLNAIERMGFKAVEIGVSRPRFKLKKVQKFLKKSELKVTSVHNLCVEGKVEPANERGDWLASPDPERRAQAVELTLETIENAKALGAGAVVLHMGSVPIEDRWDKQDMLYRLGGGSKAVAEELGVTAADVVAERAPLAPAYFDAACESIGELLERSDGVRLGIECRMGWHEVPDLAELNEMLRRFPDPRVGYWHDVGHAVLRSAMGLEGQLEWLERHGQRTVGIHIHDVNGRLRDHYPPGLGTVDFERLLQWLPSDAIRVIEIGSRYIAEEVMMARSLLEDMGF